MLFGFVSAIEATVSFYQAHRQRRWNIFYGGSQIVHLLLTCGQTWFEPHLLLITCFCLLSEIMQAGTIQHCGQQVDLVDQYVVDYRLLSQKKSVEGLSNTEQVNSALWKDY